MCKCSPADNANASIQVKNASGETVAQVSITENISVTSQDKALVGVFKKEKRKYYTSSNEMAYAVKFSDDGFKLRDHNEQLLWKVKLYDDKIKLANNEEMYSAYEIKLREGGKIKLERNESLVQEVRLDENAQSVTIGNLTVEGCGNSLAPAILLIEDLKEFEKYILMAELLAKGK
jgi:hypothetical protein